MADRLAGQEPAGSDLLPGPAVHASPHVAIQVADDKINEVTEDGTYKHLSFAKPSLVFRAFSSRYLQQIKALHDDLFPVKYTNDFYQDLAKPSCVVVLALEQKGDAKEEQLVAVSTSSIRQNGSRTESYLMTFGVKETYRRCGLGRYLLESTIGLLRARKCDSVRLHVLTSNDGALRLYQQHHFTIESHLPRHYHFDNAHHDALKLVLVLRKEKEGSIWSLCVIL